jgi:hypothetical protein
MKSTKGTIQMSATTLSTANSIDFDSLVTRSTNGERITVKHLAREFKMKSPDLKKALVDHFGSRIQFKRGRTGGIVFTA